MYSSHHDCLRKESTLVGALSKANEKGEGIVVFPSNRDWLIGESPLGIFFIESQLTLLVYSESSRGYSAVMECFVHATDDL